jgi:hypothetical protein
MYIGKHWYEECEVQVLVNQLERERDAYKRELMDWLTKASDCIVGKDADCSICPYYYVMAEGGCPSKVNTYAAKLRFEELVKEK